MDASIVDRIITGRVRPHIYAFRTGTIPDYLKVGDTYRPVNVRLDEWRAHYDALEEVYREEASVSEDVFFRDFAVHQYLEDVLNLHRLQKKEVPPEVYYSNEFFQGATKGHVESAIDNIRADFLNSGRHYHYYRFDDSRIPVETHYIRNSKPFAPRGEQAQTVKNFLKAKEDGRKNLLMFAVMRFGKSFTSMLCAQAMDAKLVVVLCGKTSVEDEWKRNVEIPKNFEGYSFKNRLDLDNNHHLISEAKVNGERIVLFLTLQDLSGDDVKERHKELFENEIDLVIIDETHFGARAPEYGKVLQEEFGVQKATSKKEYQEEEEIGDVDEVLKTLKTNIKLHLSGTPYRILMGSEFAPEDVIAFYQFSDVVDSQQKWDRDNLNNPEKKEWDNPYFGFPQMVRFAFNPSASARKLIKELKEKGKTCALSALFQPSSFIKDDEGKYRHFEHEEEILELLEVIDGSKNDDELFGFLDYDKIKDGHMCRHMVIVLPFRASCDAFQTLLESYKDRFKNLSEYKILNIAGHDCPRELQLPSGVKERIRSYEQDEKKTITLTVNKMLTGSTVEYWDTMLFFKDTASPQEYDQAIFRIQNPYVREMVSPDAEEDNKVIKFNMKPQTLLVDFDIDRLFQLQALKSQIFNANVDVSGNAKLEERMRRELEISPVIVLNKDRLKEVTPTDIMEAISEYSKNRSVADEAKDIPVDMQLLNDGVIRAEIDRQAVISSSEGLSMKPYKGDGGDVNPGDDSGKGATRDNNDSNIKRQEKVSSEELFRKRFATYYSRILFFTFLSKDDVTDLDNLISVIDKTQDNIRIANNLEINKAFLVHLRSVMDGNKLGALDFKIRNLNRLEGDQDLAPLERAKIAMRKFSRLSEAEITTPESVARDMVGSLPEDCSTSMHYLDFAAKQGEFAIALIERFGESAKTNIWSLPTSGVAYEFTRKIYSFLEMPVDHIFDSFNSFSLIDDNAYEHIELLRSMNFDVIIGNPPYQKKDGGAQRSATPIYNFFVSLANEISGRLSSFIIPSRWYAGGKGADIESFREEMLNDEHLVSIHDFTHPEDVFPNTNNRGGVCYFLRDKKFHNDNIISVANHGRNGAVHVENRPLRIEGVDIFIRSNQSIDILNKIIKKNVSNSWMEEHISAAKAFGLRTFFINDPHYKKEATGLTDPILCYGRGGSVGYVERSDIPSHKEWIDLWKVYVPESNNIGTELNDDNQNAFVGGPRTICTETYLVVGADLSLSETSVQNCSNYLKTKFARFLLSIAKVSQHGTGKTYRFVPVMDFSKSWTDTDLYEEYNLSKEEQLFIDTTIKSME